jgi:phosphatidate phosphatase PAH1
MPANVLNQRQYARVSNTAPGICVSHQSMYVLKPGSKRVLFDIDGTITVGDQEVWS